MPRQILVIDDEQAVREAFAYALKSEPYAVDLAASGEEGLAKAVESKPDLIFLDLHMPGIDGVETLRRLHASCEDVPVFIVTAFRREYMGALAKAADEGLQFEITEKPLDAEQIRTIVRSIFGPPQPL